MTAATAPLLPTCRRRAERTEVVPAELVAAYDGFNLHAATAFEAHERLAVERFCR